MSIEETKLPNADKLHYQYKVGHGRTQIMDIWISRYEYPQNKTRITKRTDLDINRQELHQRMQLSSTSYRRVSLPDET